VESASETVDRNDSIAAGKSDRDFVPRAAMLDAWARDAWNNGIQVDHLEDMQKVAVRTANNLYEIVVISAREGDVLVRGGRFFPELTPANLAGATLGGSFCKMRGIYVGFRMEFSASGRRIITSPVETIAVLPPERDREIRGGRW
jgi:hypothetical protein